MQDSATRFGAPWFPPRAASAVLRARAARYSNLALADVSDVDAAAAVVAADIWMLACGARTLDNPARYGTAAVLALSAALARAAGWPKQPAAAVLPPGWPSDAVLEAAEEYERWLSEVDLPVAEVMRLAIGDLSHGSSDHRIARAIDALSPFAA